MLRFIGFTLVCFLAPFVLYGGWRYVRTGIAPGGEAWPNAVLTRLALAGVVLMFVAIGVLVTFSGGTAGQHYQPARYENGQLVPGGFN